MNGYLLDTNVISELTKSEPDSRVIEFLMEYEDLWLSTIVLHEMHFGIGLLTPGMRRNGISIIISEFITEFSDRILPVGALEAAQAAEFRVQMRNSGQKLDLGDALIAGTAKANALALATRNVRDFDRLDIEIVNPWNRIGA